MGSARSCVGMRLVDVRILSTDAVQTPRRIDVVGSAARFVCVSANTSAAEALLPLKALWGPPFQHRATSLISMSAISVDPGISRLCELCNLCELFSRLLYNRDRGAQAFKTALGPGQDARAAE